MIKELNTKTITCLSCVFLYPYDKAILFCRRFPPTIKSNGNSEYPRVKTDLVACGEFKKEIGG